MNKRLKKKQHKLVKEWLANHPDYRPHIPLPMSVQTITYQPQEYTVRMFEPIERCDYIGTGLDAYLKLIGRKELEKVIEDNLFIKEITSEEDLHIQRKRVFEARIMLVKAEECCYGLD